MMRDHFRRCTKKGVTSQSPKRRCVSKDALLAEKRRSMQESNVHQRTFKRRSAKLEQADDTLVAYPRQSAIANQQKLGAAATHTSRWSSFCGCEQDREREGASSLSIALAVSDRLPARVSVALRCEAARPSRGVLNSVARPSPRPGVVLPAVQAVLPRLNTWLS